MGINLELDGHGVHKFMYTLDLDTHSRRSSATGQLNSFTLLSNQSSMHSSVCPSTPPLIRLYILSLCLYVITTINVKLISSRSSVHFNATFILTLLPSRWQYHYAKHETTPHTMALLQIPSYVIWSALLPARIPFPSTLHKCASTAPTEWFGITHEPAAVSG